MDIKEKVDTVHDLVDDIIKMFNEKDVPPDVVMGVGGQLFSIVCRDCGLDAEQFLYLCKGIAEKNIWPKREGKDEKAKQEQPARRESGDETRKGKHKEAKL